MSDDAERAGIVGGLVRTAFLVDAVYSRSAREYGLTQQQGQLLCVLLAESPGMGRLGAILRLAKSSVTGLVDRTERLGLVRREPDPADVRGTRISLTPLGTRTASSFYTETCRRIARLADGLAPADATALATILVTLVEDNDVPMVFSGAGPDEEPAGR